MCVCLGVVGTNVVLCVCAQMHVCLIVLVCVLVCGNVDFVSVFVDMCVSFVCRCLYVCVVMCGWVLASWLMCWCFCV